MWTQKILVSFACINNNWWWSIFRTNRTNVGIISENFIIFRSRLDWNMRHLFMFNIFKCTPSLEQLALIKFMRLCLTTLYRKYQLYRLKQIIKYQIDYDNWLYPQSAIVTRNNISNIVIRSMDQHMQHRPISLYISYAFVFFSFVCTFKLHSTLKQILIANEPNTIANKSN